MSPIVYTPPKKHECRPPWQGEVYSSGRSYLYPEGTIWECDKCGSDWELEYDYQQVRLMDGSVIRPQIARVIWNRLDD